MLIWPLFFNLSWRSWRPLGQKMTLSDSSAPSDFSSLCTFARMEHPGTPVFFCWGAPGGRHGSPAEHQPLMLHFSPCPHHEASFYQPRAVRACMASLKAESGRRRHCWTEVKVIEFGPADDWGLCEIEGGLR